MARKKEEKEPDTGAGLMVMMVSLNLILLIFFIFLNSIGENDSERVKKALGSLSGRFGLLPGGVHLMPGDEILLPGPPLVPPVMNNVSLAREIRSMVSEDELESDVRVMINGSDLVINMSNKLLFSSGSATLRATADPVLLKIAGVLKKSRFPIRIEGHTDDRVMSSGQFPSNWELSASRATSVMRRLIELKQFSGSQLSAVGFGAHRPLVQNDSVSNRAKNRRVNIVVVKGKV